MSISGATMVGNPSTLSAANQVRGSQPPEVSVPGYRESSPTAVSLFRCGRRRSGQNTVGRLDHSAVEDLSSDVFQVDIAAERTEQ